MSEWAATPRCWGRSPFLLALDLESLMQDYLFVEAELRARLTGAAKTQADWLIGWPCTSLTKPLTTNQAGR